jgi:hypothetical protein
MEQRRKGMHSRACGLERLSDGEEPGVILSRRSTAKDPEVESRKGGGAERDEEKVRSQNANSEVRKGLRAAAFSLLNSGF